jgi:hypothetical protein
MSAYFGRVSLIVALLLALPTIGGRGEEPPKKEKDKGKVAELMRKKLKHSQLILEGVAVGDFKKISESADELVLISRDAEWAAIKTPRYEIFSNQFRDNADDLIKKAKDKNLDGAALAYVDLTLTCVKCHKYVREERGAFRDRSLPENRLGERTAARVDP